MGLEGMERQDFRLDEFPPSPAVPPGRHSLLAERGGRQYGRGVSTGLWCWMIWVQILALPLLAGSLISLNFHVPICRKVRIRTV